MSRAQMELLVCDGCGYMQAGDPAAVGKPHMRQVGPCPTVNADGSLSAAVAAVHRERVCGTWRLADMGGVNIRPGSRR